MELPRRIQALVRRRRLESEVGAELGHLCLEGVEANVVVLDEAIYSALEDEARARSRRDPAHWLVVASAARPVGRDLDQRQRLPRYRRPDMDDGRACRRGSARASLSRIGLGMRPAERQGTRPIQRR